MPKRSSKKTTRDTNILASQIVSKATGTNIPKSNNKQPEKNPFAVELGRLGGLKGGKARANKLSPERRKEIAKKAAQARWHK